VPSAGTSAGAFAFSTTIESSSGVLVIDQKGPAIAHAGNSASDANRQMVNVSGIAVRISPIVASGRMGRDRVVTHS
jgi:hypothetical protein